MMKQRFLGISDYEQINTWNITSLGITIVGVGGMRNRVWVIAIAIL